MSQPMVEARALTRYFGSGHAQVCAVDEVDLTVAPGELVLVMGPSGSGKTTLLSMLGGLLRPSSGRVTLAGEEINTLPEARLAAVRGRQVGFVFQAFNLLEALTVEENILFPARLGTQSKAAARVRAAKLIEQLGLGERRRALPRTLSGGEKQRVAIARALINRPPLILADEPTGNLDSQSGQEVMMILHDIARDEGRSVILVTHDPRVEEVADRILWLEDGALRERQDETHDWVRDPVCGMRVDAWTSNRSTTHAGETYHFCSERCLERFEAAPERYRTGPAASA